MEDKKPRTWWILNHKYDSKYGPWYRSSNPSPDGCWERLEVVECTAYALQAEQLKIAIGALKSLVGYEPFQHSLEPRRASEALDEIEKLGEK